MDEPGFHYRFTVRLHDTDAAGVLFFGHLFRHLHDAYEAFLGDLGLDLPALVRGAGPGLPIVHAEADYLAPVRHGETLTVAVRPESVGRTSFTLAYGIRSQDGTLKGRARTVHVAVDTAEGRAAMLPGALRVALGGAD